MRVQFYGRSFVGRRESNEDAIATSLIHDKYSVYFFAVADGMGGVVGGEIASRIVLKICSRYLKKYFENNSPPFDLKLILTAAIQDADNTLRVKTKANPLLTGMGSTLTCVLIVENRYIVANIGDSRTYKFDSQRLEQITKDHSEIEKYRDEHGKKADESLEKQYGHLVTKVLDGKGDKPDIFPPDGEPYILEEGTGFLLCSDGLLVNQLKDDPSVLHKFCMGNKTIRSYLESLISYAYLCGSSDNISVVGVEIGKIKKSRFLLSEFEFPPKEKEVPKNADQRMRDKFIITTLLIVFVLLAVGFLKKRFIDHSKDKPAISKSLSESAVDSDTLVTSTIKLEYRELIPGDGDSAVKDKSGISWRFELKSKQNYWINGIENSSVRNRVLVKETEWDTEPTSPLRYKVIFAKDSTMMDTVLIKDTDKYRVSLKELDNLKEGMSYYWRVIAAFDTLKSTSPVYKIVVKEEKYGGL